MVRIKKIRAFTLMETLVAGIITSVVSGLAMMTYLNIANTIESTGDLWISEKATLMFDSLSNIKGAYEVNYLWEGSYQVVGEKQLYEDNVEGLYQLTLEVGDTTGHIMSRQKKLIYEY